MHRHAVSRRQLGRDRDQRRALIKNLASSLILAESLETTLPKAKELVPYIERIVSKAKKDSLHNRRQVMALLTSAEAVTKLYERIVPGVATRSSGFVRLKRSSLRKGDGAQLAVVSFVDSFETASPAPEAAPKPAAPKKTAIAAKESK